MTCLSSLLSFNSYAFFNLDKSDTPKQNKLCVAANGDEAKDKCKDGDVFMWQPSLFGNEQYPIMYIALMCDFRYQITYNNGGVSCIFTTKRSAQWQDFGIKKG